MTEEMKSTKFWRFRCNAKGQIVPCNVRTDNMETYVEHYRMKEYTDPAKLAEEFMLELSKDHMPCIQSVFKAYFDESLTNSMLNAVIKTLGKFEGLRLVQCKDCKGWFGITDRDVKWYTDHELNVPKRCGTCRKRRKDAAKKEVKKD